MKKEAVRNDPILRRFLGQLAALRKRIGKIILFGSRARGDDRPWSDYDLILIVDQRDQSLVDHIYEGVVEIQADTGCDLSLKIIPEAEWDRRRRLGSRFVANVMKEGIVLG